MGNALGTEGSEGDPSSPTSPMDAPLFPSHPLGPQAAPRGGSSSSQQPDSSRHARRAPGFPTYVRPSTRADGSSGSDFRVSGSRSHASVSNGGRDGGPSGKPTAFVGEYVHMDKMEEMMRMFQEALEVKKTALQSMELSVQNAESQLELIKSKDYDEEFLLQELQRLLTANNQLLQYKAQLESENKMLQEEGDLLSQQLESVTFYTKNMTVELDKERRARKKVESTAEAMRHALKVVYRNLRSVRTGKGKKGMATPHKALKDEATFEDVPTHLLDELAAELDEELENVDSNGVDANVVGGSSSSDRQ